MAVAVAKKKRLSREEQKAARSRELLDAAWELFCEHGYEALTIDVIAEHAGYSRMPVYSLFGDKQNLFFELWKQKSADISAVLLDGCKAGKPLATNIRQMAKNLIASKNGGSARYGEQLFFVVQTVSLNRPDIREKLDALASEHFDAIAGMIESSTLGKGQVLRRTPLVVAQHFVSYINGSSNVEFHTHEVFHKLEDLHEILMSMALK